MEDIIRERIRDLKKLELYFYSDNRIFDFFRDNPANNDELVVNEKISAVNNGIIPLSLVPTLARHMMNSGIDEALANNDLTIVSELEELDHVTATQQLKYFCSSYCTFHKPDVYPVHSPTTVGLLKLLFEKTGEDGSPDLTSYHSFKTNLDEVITKYELDELSYYEIDKFFWVNASRIRSFLENPAADI